jgi:glutathione S-transferase
MPLLHHHPLSAGSRFVRLVLAEFGEEPTLVEQTPWDPSPDLLALDPGGALPILVDDNGAAIAGAAIIAEYLHETRGIRFGEEPLMPPGPVERAEMRRLMHWFGTRMNAEVTESLIHEKLFKRQMPASRGGGSPDSVAIRNARSRIRDHVRYIGELSDHRNWLAGRELTLADLAAAAEISCIDYLGEVPWDEDERARAWYARIKSRLSFRPILSDLVRGAPPARHYANLDF